MNSFSKPQLRGATLAVVIGLAVLAISLFGDSSYRLSASDLLLFDVCGGFAGQAPHYRLVSPLGTLQLLLHSAPQLFSLLMAVFAASFVATYISQRFALSWGAALALSTILITAQQLLFLPGSEGLKLMGFLTLLLWLHESTRARQLARPLVWIPLTILCISELWYLGALVLVMPYLLSSGEQPMNKMQIQVVAAAVFIVAVATPFYEFQPIDIGERVVAERAALLNGTDPIFGQSVAYQVTDRMRLRSLIALGTFVTFLFSLIVWFQFHLRSRERVFAKLACILSATALADSALVPENISLLSPLYTLERFLPGALNSPFAPGVLVIASGLLFFATIPKVRVPPLWTLCTLTVIVASVGGLSGFASGRVPVVSQQTIEQLLTRIGGPASEVSADSLLRSSSIQVLPVLIERKENVAIWDIERFPKNAFSSCAELGCQLVSASHNEEQLRRLVEEALRPMRRNRYRVPPSTHASFRIELPGEQGAQALSLHSEPFISDFPRRFHYSYSPDCEHWSPPLRMDPWQGPIVFRNGLPIIMHESSVTLFTSEPFKCFEFEKIANGGIFDWSLTHITALSSNR